MTFDMFNNLSLQIFSLCFSVCIPLTGSLVSLSWDSIYAVWGMRHADTAKMEQHVNRRARFHTSGCGMRFVLRLRIDADTANWIAPCSDFGCIAMFLVSVIENAWKRTFLWNNTNHMPGTACRIPRIWNLSLMLSDTTTSFPPLSSTTPTLFPNLFLVFVGDYFFTEVVIPDVSLDIIIKLRYLLI